MKVQIDPLRCRGHARCLDIAPDAFDFIDEEDRAIVVDDGVRRTNIGALLEAQEECPEQAISVEDDDAIRREHEGTEMTTARPKGYDLTAIDHHADYFVEHNYEIYEDLRAKCPIAHSTEYGGFYIFLDYDTVYDADHDTETFSSAPGRNTPPNSPPPQFVPLDSDPPQHTQYRRIGVPYFSPKQAKKDEPYFRQVATELIDEFIEDGEVDIVGKLTTPLPAIWILKMLGFDETRWREWVTGCTR